MGEQTNFASVQHNTQQHNRIRIRIQHLRYIDLLDFKADSEELYTWIPYVDELTHFLLTSIIAVQRM